MPCFRRGRTGNNSQREKLNRPVPPGHPAHLSPVRQTKAHDSDARRPASPTRRRPHPHRTREKPTTDASVASRSPSAPSVRYSLVALNGRTTRLHGCARARRRFGCTMYPPAIHVRLRVGCGRPIEPSHRRKAPPCPCATVL